MKCLSLDEVMMEMADFDVGVCSSAEKFVNDQDLDKAIRKVHGTFDGVENLSAEQRERLNCEFYSQRGCFGGFTNGIREINVISVNSWTLC